MKGVLIAGGYGVRLAPLTNVLNKHMLLIYDKPMIDYGFDTLLRAGCNEIAIVLSDRFPELIRKYLDSQYSAVKKTYVIQPQPAGISHAICAAESFTKNEPFVAYLADNVFDDEMLISKIRSWFQKPDRIQLFVRATKEAERLGVWDPVNRKFVEKPANPPSMLALTGCICLLPSFFEVARSLRPSLRGELEITDALNILIEREAFQIVEVNGFWRDCGTFESLYEGISYMRLRKMQ